MDINPSTTPIRAKRPFSDRENFKHMFDGMHLPFPIFKHDHPPVVNVNEVADEQLTLGQRIADKVAAGMGSWRFIIIQSAILILWATLNSVGWWSWKWDLYPFIAMNLLLSCQAAYAAPVIMMSQNRQAEKDRLTAQNDYVTDCKGEEEIRHIMEHLDHQDALILQIVNRLEEQHMEMRERLNQIDPALFQRLVADVQRVIVERNQEQKNAEQ
jgi:uncharacterized membrane protein